MAHGEHCIGRWKDTLLGGVPDGDIRIDSHDGGASTPITGRHIDSNSPISGTCDGSSQSFSRETETETIFYRNGVIKKDGNKFKIKGKFERKPKKGQKSGARGGKKDSDDWTAEKPVTL